MPHANPRKGIPLARRIIKSLKLPSQILRNLDTGSHGDMPDSCGYIREMSMITEDSNRLMTTAKGANTCSIAVMFGN